LLPPLFAAGDAAGVDIEPTITAEPTPQSYEVQVVVETQGFGVPDNLVMETNLGAQTAYRHEILEPNHYRDYVNVPLETTMLWIFEHEGYGDRQDESWEIFPAIVETPLTLTVSIHNPVAPCQETAETHCGYVTGTGDQAVVILNKNKIYQIDLAVDYTRGAGDLKDRFAVTSTVR
jgi:hypothetical protein